MGDLKPCRPDIEIQSLCRELRQQGYLVPYTVMAKATQNVAISLAPTVQEAAKVLLGDQDARSTITITICEAEIPPLGAIGHLSKTDDAIGIALRTLSEEPQ